jgi:site-specific DNA recombinase
MNKPSQNIKRVALYMRVSTIEQARDGYGLDSQDRILRAFVKANEDIGWITSENLIYRDEGISGTTEVQDRPELTKLRNDIIDGKVDVLLVWKIDRLFRKTAYLLDFIEFLKTHNINFVSKNENIDLSSPTGKLVLTLLGAISEMERDVITERTHE